MEKVLTPKGGTTYSADVVVVGGGPSGVCAAIAAAREGSKTVLIEQGGCCGGMATRGLVGPFMTCYDKDGEIQVIKGLFEEIVNRMVDKGGAIHPSEVRKKTAYTSWIEIGHDHVTPFCPETLKLVLDEMLEEENVEILYHTTFLSVIMEDSCVTGLRVSSKSGVEEVRGKVFIDCTGDGDVAFAAGVEFEIGNEELGITQPATMFFRICNVDDERIEKDIQDNIDNFYRKDGVNYRSFHWRVAQAREDGNWPLKRVSIGLFKSVNGEWCVNTSRVMGVDATNNQSLTSGEIEGRKQAKIIMDFLRKYVPGCEDAKLMATASTLGIRESRHMKGVYSLNRDDILNGVVPEDAIALASNSVDVHGRFGALSNQYVPIQNGSYYGIPYRCLLPKTINNLLVPCRSVSASSEAAGAIRVMPPMMALGQAAGVAGAMVAQGSTVCGEINVKELQEKLKKQGAVL